MRLSFTDAGWRSSPVLLSYLALIGIVSCAKANPPEEFVADPSLQDDFTASLPAFGSSMGFQYAIVQGLAIYEGDILLGRVDSNGMLADRFQARGVGRNDAFSRWPDGIVIYEKPVNSSQLQQDNVEKAIAHWTEHTTLSFVERTPENAEQYPHYIRFLDTMSCASHVGMIGGEQPIYISDACSVGSVIHEIGHAVGLFHEHTRPDRDNFVQINWDEVRSGKDINFFLQTTNVDTYSEYDYASIMHYGETFFSISGAPTIIVADGIEIGQREGLSQLDIDSVNRMYQTDLALGTPALSRTDTGFDIDITSYNYGNLGAHDIELSLDIGDDAEWVGVSADSGWLCLTFGAKLQCTRDTFREQTESRFSVQVETAAGADDLKARLSSRTQDSDPSNNVYNDYNVQSRSATVEVASIADETPPVQTSVPPMTTPAEQSPPLLAANASQSNPFQTNGADASASAGGGGVNLSLLLAFAMMAGLRQRRTIAVIRDHCSKRTRQAAAASRNC